MFPRLLAAVAVWLVLAPAAAASDGWPKYGTPLGRLVVPAIGLNQQWVEGGTDPTEVGYLPTHNRQSYWPDEDGTVAIAAHHATHPLPGARHGVFWRLHELQPGDLILLSLVAKYGGVSQTYVVVGKQIVDCGWNWQTCPRATAAFGKLGTKKLVLSTCGEMGLKRLFVYAYPVIIYDGWMQFPRR